MHEKERLRLEEITAYEIRKTIRDNFSLMPLAKKYNINLGTMDAIAWNAGVNIYKEIKAAKIRKALKTDISSIEQLSAFIGLGEADILKLCKERRITLPSRFLTKEEVLDTIDKHGSLNSLVKKYGIGIDTLSKRIRKTGISPFEEIKVRNVKKALEQGAGSSLELCAASGYSYDTVIRLVKDHNIKLPFKPEYVITIVNRRPWVDFLLRKGLSQTEIGKIVGMSMQGKSFSRAAIHAYAKGTQQVGVWKKRKQEVKFARDYLRKEMIKCMYNNLFQKASKESWPDHAAITFCSTPKLNMNKLNRYDSIRKFYANYEQAVLNNEKKTLIQLTEGTGIESYASASRMIRSIGLKSLIKRRK